MRFANFASDLNSALQTCKAFAAKWISGNKLGDRSTILCKATQSECKVVEMHFPLLCKLACKVSDLLHACAVVITYYVTSLPVLYVASGKEDLEKNSAAVFSGLGYRTGRDNKFRLIRLTISERQCIVAVKGEV